nr:TonB-dependent receptor plug domain-containing protein [Allomuricauda sp.]
MRIKLSIFIFSTFLFFEGWSQEVKTTAIFWDCSASRLERDHAKEMEYLNAYFQRFKNSSVVLVGFSDVIHSKENFKIVEGDWSKLQSKIESFKYDGATSFQGLEDFSVEGYNLLFTDGKQNLKSSNSKVKGNLVVINSSKDFDRGTITLLSIISKADFLNLHQKAADTPEEATASSVNEVGQQVGSTENGVTSESTGSDFKSGIVLDEVVVKENVEVDAKVNTALGQKNKDAIGYAVQSIDAEMVPDAATTVNTAIQGKFSGVSLGQSSDLSQTVLRPSNSLLGNNYGLIVVDGVPLAQSRSGQNGYVFSTGFLDPKNIEDVTVLKGLVATNIYGTQGSNGVLLITTKTGSFKNSSEPERDALQLTDNFYDTKIKIDNKALVTPYLKELKKGKNVEDAYGIYLNQRERFQNSSDYLLDVFDFFYSSSPKIAFRILSNIVEEKSAAYEALRGAYLKSLEKENYGMAMAFVNRAQEKYPDKIQNHYDLAIVQRKMGNYQAALNTLNGMLTNTLNRDLNFSGIEKPLGSEIRNLVNQHKNQLDVSKVDTKYRNNITYNARLILEWNNPDAEFTVQFVNPQKRFFDWEHSELNEGTRISDELENGYFIEQFEIVGAETVGEWILNVTSLGNRTKNNSAATFLKCTVQKNFGKSNQTSSSYIVRVQGDKDKKQLAKFNVE